MTTIDEVYGWGHKNIQCSHKTTIEITKDSDLTKNGDCILAVNASKACYDLNLNLKNQIRKGKKFKIIIKVGDIQDQFYGVGSKDLTLSDKRDMVFRKSSFICDRTVLIKCSKSSKELDRELVDILKQSKKKLSLTIGIDE
ncbi:MAG: DUF371 domain-containing protein [Promethearchaeota archaeon]|jgi:hypothetical protein